MIPEVILEKGYDKSVDLYLFGLLAYELMTGKAAYPPDLLDLEERVLRQEYQMPLHLTPDCRDMLQKLIRVDPDQRHQIKHLKKHPCFKGIDWKQVTEGKLKMPPPLLRPI